MISRVLALLAAVLLGYEPVGSFYSVALRPSDETATECAVVHENGTELARARAELVDDAVHGVGHLHIEVRVPARRSAPDAIVRAVCSNAAGTSSPSAAAACLDLYPEDCLRPCGDVSGDGRISLVDVGLLGRWLLNPERPLALEWCDVLPDGECDSGDFAVLRSIVAGAEFEDPLGRCAGRIPLP